MKSVTANPQFISLSKEEILTALDACEALYTEMETSPQEGKVSLDCEVGEDECDPKKLCYAIVEEVERLIREYSAYFDAYCREHGEVPEESLVYQPQTPIEQMAFQIFTEALHDSVTEEAED